MNSPFEVFYLATIYTLFSNLTLPLLSTSCNRIQVSVLSGYPNGFAAAIVQVQSWRTLAQLMLNWHLRNAIAAWVCKIQQEGPWRRLSQPTKSLHPYAVLSEWRMWEGMGQLGLGMQWQLAEMQDLCLWATALPPQPGSYSVEPLGTSDEACMPPGDMVGWLDWSVSALQPDEEPVLDLVAGSRTDHSHLLGSLSPAELCQ